MRKATTPNRLRLSADLVRELEDRATAEGLDVAELVARLLVQQLPDMVASEIKEWLGRTLALAYPIEATVGRVPTPAKSGVCTRHDGSKP